jgi:hypothetical protein
MTFFHEFAHHHAVIKNKWEDYHWDKKQFTAKQSFDIENKIDRIAEKLWYKYVNIKEWGRYRYGYKKSEKKELVEWLKLYY